MAMTSKRHEKLIAHSETHASFPLVLLRRTLVFIAFACASVAAAAPLQIRIATYNASLNRTTQGALASDLAVTTNAQARQVAEILQRVRPDIVLINEFDYDAANPTLALTRFHDNYLAVSQNGQPVLSYPYRYIAPSNTGVPTGKTLPADGDFDNNGSITSTPGSNNYGNDCYGFGVFPGQYSFVVYSRFPIQTAAMRSFQFFKWKDMPGAALPDDVSTLAASDWYSASELNIFRLSSKNHVDLPIEVKPGHIIHLLASHPTPPAFETGANAIASDYNGHRNHDEIRLWADYVNNASYLYDDTGVFGGLAPEQRFVILGDMNADPLDGDSYLKSINQLRQHPLINATANPSSPGGTQQTSLQRGVNTTQTGDPANDTSDFYDGSGGAGNLRVDHVLPSKLGFGITGSGVFWPLNTDPTFALVSASDHRLVWLDVAVTPIVSQAVKSLAAVRQSADVVLTWGTQSGVSYQVQTSLELSDWANAPAITVMLNNTTHTATATDAGAGAGPEKFYRVVCTLDGP